MSKHVETEVGWRSPVFTTLDFPVCVAATCFPIKLFWKSSGLDSSHSGAVYLHGVPAYSSKPCLFQQDGSYPDARGSP